jgi:hypothetical protein
MIKHDNIESLNTLSLIRYPIDENNDNVNEENSKKREIYLNGVIDAITILTDNDGWVRIEHDYAVPKDGTLVALFDGHNIRLAKYSERFHSYEPIVFDRMDDFHYTDAKFYKVINPPIYKEDLKH